MEIIAFDENWSYFHFGLGFVSYFMPQLIILYLVYQLLSLIFKKETIDYTLGDIVEFEGGLGCMFTITYLLNFLG
ncbi:MAG: hypothetical protein QXS74_06345 [Nitrososphaeria archaeon]